MIPEIGMSTGRGGGVCRLPILLSMLIAALLGVSSACLPAFAKSRPTTEEELIETVRTAIEKADFEAFEDLVLWTDVSPFKRRLISVQIRHGLDRPIGKITLEHADTATRFDLQRMRGVRLNMPVTYLLRVAYNDEPGELGGTPGAVYMVGKLDGVYRIAVLVRSETHDDD